MLKILVFLLLIVVSQAQNDGNSSGTNKPEVLFRGVTVSKPPFLEKDNSTGKFCGFFVDLLDELARVGKFNYTLEDLRRPEDYWLENDKFNVELIHRVFQDKAEFALSESLFNDGPFLSYVSFTEPYLTSGFSVLVRKSLLERENITNFVELLEKTRRPTEGLIPIEEERMQAKNIQIGFVNSSHPIFRQMNKAIDPIGRELYERVIRYPQNQVESRIVGVLLATQHRYAFIQESFKNQLEVNKNCKLTHLPVEVLPELEYSFAVPRNFRNVYENSVIADSLNDAIKQLRESGKLEEIRRKYFNRKCQTEKPEVDSNYSKDSQTPRNSALNFSLTKLILLLFFIRKLFSF